MVEKMKNNKDKKESLKEVKIVSKRRFVRCTPDKLRLAAHLVKKEEKLLKALDILQFSKVNAAKYIILSLKSAASSVQDKNILPEDLIIKSICINEGPKLKRRRIIHRGRATQILKRLAHIDVILAEMQKKDEKVNSLAKVNKSKKIRKKNGS